MPRGGREVQRGLRTALLRRKGDIKLLAELTVRLLLISTHHLHRHEGLGQQVRRNRVRRLHNRHKLSNLTFHVAEPRVEVLCIRGGDLYLDVVLVHLEKGHFFEQL